MRYQFDTANALSNEQKAALHLEPRPEASLDMMLLGFAVYIITTVTVMMWAPMLLVGIVPLLGLATCVWTLLMWNTKRWSEHCYTLLETPGETPEALIERYESEHQRWSGSRFAQNNRYATTIMLGTLLAVVYSALVVVCVLAMGSMLDVVVEIGGKLSVLLLLVGFSLFVWACWVLFVNLAHVAKTMIGTVISWIRREPFEL